ncbi:lipopolysaccharide biosynthesis protein [Croceicoccus pelagius]|uniref:Polysaccharide biosynthesis protein n=1 Tax=Croceicoccus pelagius TaxID=1703341 RepID=A0A916Y9Q9_9SPHN|nr:polysaccharide biosynthesis C-terminal domain-containing protein [Croceicoccus pelagius]GGD36765.1 hypothetical protein GCM10010989_08600 [Croceicoccus pelagius]
MRARLARGIFAVGYSKAVHALVQLALIPVLANAWGLQVYGQWLVFASIPIFLAAADFGFGTVAGNRMVGEIAIDAPEEARMTFQSALVMVLSGAVLISLGCLCVAMLAPDSLMVIDNGMSGREARRVLGFFGIYAAMIVLMPLLVGSAKAEGRLAGATAIMATCYLVESIAVILLAGSGYSPLYAAGAMMILRTFGIALLAIWVNGFASWLRFGFSNASKRRIAELWRPSLAAMLLPISQAGYLQGIAIAAGAVAGTAVIPVYAAMRTISRLPAQLLAPLAIPLMPEFAAARARGDTRRSSSISGGLLVASLAVGITGATVVGFGGSQILEVWTSGAIDAPQAMIAAFGVLVLCQCLWAPVSDLLLAINRHEIYTAVYAASAALSLALTFPLVHALGITGAALAGLLLEAVMVLAVGYSIQRWAGPVMLNPVSLGQSLSGRGHDR